MRKLSRRCLKHFQRRFLHYCLRSPSMVRHYPFNATMSHRLFRQIGRPPRIGKTPSPEGPAHYLPDGSVRGGSHYQHFLHYRTISSTARQHPVLLPQNGKCRVNMEVGRREYLFLLVPPAIGIQQSPARLFAICSFRCAVPVCYEVRSR